MSKTTKNRLLTLTFVGVIAGLIAFFVSGYGGGSTSPGPQEEEPAPDDPVTAQEILIFQWGLKAGNERAGFAGCPMVQVIQGDTFGDVSACLSAPEVVAAMDGFVGAIVSPEDLPKAASAEKPRLQVIVRDLSGPILGGLSEGFACDELVALLTSIRSSRHYRASKSPIYRRLLQSPAPVEALVPAGQVDRARRLVELLKECEGPESEAVKNAAAVLPK